MVASSMLMTGENLIINPVAMIEKDEDVLQKGYIKSESNVFPSTQRQHSHFFGHITENLHIRKW